MIFDKGAKATEWIVDSLSTNGARTTRHPYEKEKIKYIQTQTFLTPITKTNSNDHRPKYKKCKVLGNNIEKRRMIWVR